MRTTSNRELARRLGVSETAVRRAEPTRQVLSAVQLNLACGLDEAMRELATAREELQTTRAALQGAAEELGEVRAVPVETTAARAHQGGGGGGAACPHRAAGGGPRPPD